MKVTAPEIATGRSLPQTVSPPRWYWIVSAIPLLALSLIAAFIQFGYVLFGLGALEALGAAATLPFPIVILAIGTALLWLAVHARGRGWIS